MGYSSHAGAKISCCDDVIYRTPQSKILATPMRLPAAYCVDGVIMLKILTVGESSHVQE